MLYKNVRVSTINDDLSDFDYLFKLYETLKTDDLLTINLSFEHCNFLRQNAVAFLGGMARVIERNGGQVLFDWSTLKPGIRKNLEYNNFKSIFNDESFSDSGNSVPYREDLLPNKEDIINYLKNDWLGQNRINLSEGLKPEIIGTVYEIYTNAFEHSLSTVGVLSCGQYYPKQHILKLTVIDFGKSIPENVRTFMGNKDISSSDALRWAFQQGASTASEEEEIGRGMGLDLLKNFVAINDGKLEIFSSNGYAVVDKNSENYYDRDTFFQGTLVNISIQCDESYYALDEEIDNDLEFLWG